MWAINPSLVKGKDGEILLPLLIVPPSMLIITSGLIVTRLILLKRRVASVLGREHAKHYISI